MKRRLGFGIPNFCHIIATTNIEQHPKPNAVAAVFFASFDIPKHKMHVVQVGDEYTETTAMDALQKTIEEFVGKDAQTVRDY